MAFLIHASIVLVALGAANGEAYDRQLTGELMARFDNLIENPGSYLAAVKQECGGFPEGDLFPFLFPAFAYTNMAMEDAKTVPDAVEKVEKLLSLAIPMVGHRTRAPGGRLDQLESYRKHATYLCQLDVGLGAYRLLGGTKFDSLHEHLTGLIRNALVESNGDGNRWGGGRARGIPMNVT